MKKFKNKLIIYLLCSYIILVPLINNFMKLLEKSFQINLNTIDITLLNLFTIIFRNKIILLIFKNNKNIDNTPIKEEKI